MAKAQILEKGEVWNDSSDDPKFLHTVIVFHDSDYRNFFVARWPDRQSKFEQLSTLDLESLEKVLVSPDRIFPPFDSAAFTICPNPTSPNVFVKRPCLLGYDPKSDWIREVFPQEAQVCETQLKNHPHVNIAQYLGCEVRNSRVTGLCYKKYQSTLSDRIRQRTGSSDYQSCIRGIRSGIDHLHQLGYCHNDINPMNIMFDENDTSIIIDFDSCRPEGADLGHKVGSMGYSEEFSEQSQRWNDLYGLSQIQNFLENHSADMMRTSPSGSPIP